MGKSSCQNNCFTDNNLSHIIIIPVNRFLHKGGNLTKVFRYILLLLHKSQNIAQFYVFFFPAKLHKSQNSFALHQNLRAFITGKSLYA